MSNPPPDTPSPPPHLFILGISALTHPVSTEVCLSVHILHQILAELRWCTLRQMLYFVNLLHPPGSGVTHLVSAIEVSGTACVSKKLRICPIVSGWVWIRYQDLPQDFSLLLQPWDLDQRQRWALCHEEPMRIKVKFDQSRLQKIQDISWRRRLT